MVSKTFKSKQPGSVAQVPSSQKGLYVILISRVTEPQKSRINIRITRVTDIAETVNNLNLKVVRSLAKRFDMNAAGAASEVDKRLWKIEVTLGRVPNATAVKEAWIGDSKEGSPRGLRNKARRGLALGLGLELTHSDPRIEPGRVSWNDRDGNFVRLLRKSLD